MINKCLCVVENGLFQSWAHRLAKDYDRVLLFRPWAESFSHLNDRYIGTGYESFERIENFWDHVQEVDTFCFADVHFPDWADHLRLLGKNVWSPFYGEELELLRFETKQLLTDIGIKVAPYEVVYGITALRDYLEEHDDQYVKVSKFRGVTETFHSQNYALVRVKIDELEHELGGASNIQEFIVEEAVEAVSEVGYDGFTIDGQFPKTSTFGCEIKDAGYLGVVKPYAQFPKEIRQVNDKLSEVLKQYGYRGFFSSEIRITKDAFYPVDFTCRAASPAGEALQELYSNWGEIIEGGSQGDLVEPTVTSKYAAQAILTSNFATQNWLPISIPEKIRDKFKLYHSCIVEGQEYVVPTAGVEMIELGSVVGVGNTPDEAIKKVKEYVDQAEAFELKNKVDSLADAKKELFKAS